MDNLERAMQFMREMQAKHEAWLQEHREAIKKHDEAIKRHDEEMADIRGLIAANTTRIAQLVDVTLSLANHAEETAQQIRALAESQAHTDQRLDAMVDIAQATDRKLSALIDAVDKLTRRNGGTPKP